LARLLLQLSTEAPYGRSGLVNSRPAIVFGGGQEYLVGRAGVHDEAPAES
jgi:hypothetical protein